MLKISGLLTTSLRIFTSAQASMCQAFDSLWASFYVAAQFVRVKKVLEKLRAVPDTQLGSNSGRQLSIQPLGTIVLPTSTELRAGSLDQPYQRTSQPNNKPTHRPSAGHPPDLYFSGGGGRERSILHFADARAKITYSRTGACRPTTNCREPFDGSFST